MNLEIPVAMNVGYLYLFSRHFESPSNDSKLFKFFCLYVFGIGFLHLFLLTLELFTQIFRQNLFFQLFTILSYPLFTIVTVIFMIMTAVKIFQMSRDANLARNSRFQAEKDRSDFIFYFLSIFQFVTLAGFGAI